ncbi:AMP-binding protein [Azospirillum griseum]|nr:AMP-binding protein [Azospirillum griseum]
MGNRPSWIHPAFCLLERDGDAGWTAWRWPDLADHGLPSDGVVVAASASAVLRGVVAAERDNRAILLLRHGGDAAGWLGEPGFAVTLESSGTTGLPKRVRHTFNRLQGRVRGRVDPSVRWLMTYDAGAFAGLQVLLTAAMTGATLVSVPGAGVQELAEAARLHAVTHISGTPSFWRAFLMALAGGGTPPLRSITLGGEAADQAVLDRLAAAFPLARLRHIYASTEAGAVFGVSDGRAGFPARWLDEGVDDVSLRVCDGVLELRSPRAMTAAGDGWLSTGDLVTRVGDRVLFAGRVDGVVNVGGVKVSPEAVEQRLLAVPGVAEVLVQAKPNPITGFLLTAQIVPASDVEETVLRARMRDALAELVPAARPRVITLTDRIPLAITGKKGRKAQP